MRTTVTIDDSFIERAMELTGTSERSALIRDALEALIARESARRLVLLGGSDPDAWPLPATRPRRVILVDTSIWVDHLRTSDARLAGLLERSEVLTHSMVVGELALGSISPREVLLDSLEALPRAVEASPAEVRHLVESAKAARPGHRTRGCPPPGLGPADPRSPPLDARPPAGDGGAGARPRRRGQLTRHRVPGCDEAARSTASDNGAHGRHAGVLLRPPRAFRTRG